VRAQKRGVIDFQTERFLKPGEAARPGDRRVWEGQAITAAAPNYTVQDGEHGLYSRKIQLQVTEPEYRNLEEEEPCQIGDEVGRPDAHEVGPYEPFDPAKTTHEMFSTDFGTARRPVRTPNEMDSLFS
jgi:hypothetical protein